MSAVATVALGFALTSLTALLLARIGHFDGLLTLSLAGAATFVASPFISPWPHKIPRRDLILVVLLCGVAAVYAAYFMSIDLVAGRDNGVYNLIAHRVASSGSVNFDTDSIHQARTAVGENAIPKYPGVYEDLRRGLSLNPRDFTAQFNHVSAIVRAIGLDLWGEPGLRVATGVFTLFAVASFTLLVSSYLTIWWGLLGGLFLAVNAAFVYVARSTLTEVFCLSFFSFALLFGHLAVRYRTGSAAVMTGLMVGCVFLSRPDGYLVLPFPFLLTMVLLDDSEFSPKPAILMWGVVSVLFLWSVFDLWRFSQPYLSDLSRLSDLDILLEAAALAVLAGWGLIALRIFFPSVSRRLFGFVLATAAGPLGQLAIGVAALTFGYLFLRACIPETFGSAPSDPFAIRVPREVTWYTTLPLFLLAYAGASELLRRNRRDAVPIVATGIALLTFFLSFTEISADHPWGARRWVPFLIPLVIFFGLVALASLFEKRKPAALAAVAAIFGLYFYQQHRMARDWWFAHLQADLQLDFDQLASILSGTNARLFLAKPAWVASVLNYNYGIPVAPLAEFGVNSCFARLPDLPTFCFKTLAQETGEGEASFFGHTRLIESCPRVAVFAPIIPTRSAYCFSTVLNNGWSQPESWGTWTTGKSASAMLEFANPLPANALTITIEGRGYVAPALPTQTVGVVLEGQKMQTWVFDAKTSQGKIILEPPEDLTRGKKVLRLRIDVSDPRSPLSLGLSQDDRTLGFGLTGIAIRNKCQAAGCA